MNQSRCGFNEITKVIITLFLNCILKLFIQLKDVRIELNCTSLLFEYTNERESLSFVGTMLNSFVIYDIV